MDALLRESEGDLAGADNSLLIAETTILGLLPAGAARPLVEEIGRMSDVLHLGMNELERKEQHYGVYRTQRSRPKPGTGPQVI